MAEGCCHGECHPSNFLLNHHQPRMFVNSQWPIPQIVYLIYRVLVALFFLVWIILSGAWPYDWYTTEENRVKWFIYLTNWMFLTMTVALIVHAVVVIVAYVKHRKADVGCMPWYYKATWVLYNLATNSGVLVSLLFWALLWTPGTDVHPVDWNTHGTNSIYILVDLFITGIPVRIHHFFHGLIFSATFLVFSVIYDYSGGTNALDFGYIYSVIDWTADPSSAAIYAVAAGVVGCIVIWCVIYGIYWIRIAIYRAACKDKVEPKDMEMNRTGMDNSQLSV